MQLNIIVGTIRQNRLSIRLAKWVEAEAKQLTDTTVTMVDLKDYPMPFFDEPISPRYNPDRHLDPIVQKWLDAMAPADAFIFVTPEYNHSFTSVLKNAIDYLTFELDKKPAMVVSHGTVGGARAAMQLKDVLSESLAAVIPKGVALIDTMEFPIDEAGNLNQSLKAAPYGPQTALKTALGSLKWYSDALAAARAKEK